VPASQSKRFLLLFLEKEETERQKKKELRGRGEVGPEVVYTWFLFLTLSEPRWSRTAEEG
jgi:hypothetical protein